VKWPCQGNYFWQIAIPGLAYAQKACSCEIADESPRFSQEGAASDCFNVIYSTLPQCKKKCVPDKATENGLGLRAMHNLIHRLESQYPRGVSGHSLGDFQRP
jgi:hypothetical protein